MLNRQKVQIHEAVDAVGQAPLLILVEFGAFHAASDALCPAHLRQLVSLCD
jgi:hypothetical protein